MGIAPDCHAYWGFFFPHPIETSQLPPQSVGGGTSVCSQYCAWLNSHAARSLFHLLILGLRNEKDLKGPSRDSGGGGGRLWNRWVRNQFSNLPAVWDLLLRNQCCGTKSRKRTLELALRLKEWMHLNALGKPQWSCESDYIIWNRVSSGCAKSSDLWWVDELGLTLQSGFLLHADGTLWLFFHCIWRAKPEREKSDTVTDRKALKLLEIKYSEIACG